MKACLNSYDTLIVFRFCTLLASLAFTVGALATDSDQTNVLLIITDEHNFRTLGCYRDVMPREQAEMWGRGAVITTPHIDRLAAEGVYVRGTMPLLRCARLAELRCSPAGIRMPPECPRITSHSTARWPPF